MLEVPGQSSSTLLYKQWRVALLDEARTFRKLPMLSTSAVY
jgi:hypothetical protein